MSKFIGRIADIGIAKEGTRGTAESSATFWIPKLSMSCDDGIEQIVDESSIGVVEDAPDASVVGKYAEGEIEGNIGDASFGLFLLAAIGSVSTSADDPESGVNTHTFSVDQSAQHPSLTFFLDDANQDYTYALGMISQLQLDVALGQYAKFMAQFRSKVGTTGSHTPSYSAENLFLPQHGSVKIASAVSGLDAAAEVEVRNVQLTINKNIEDDRKLGSLDQADILNKQFSVEGTIELVFDDETFKTQMLADTAQAMRLRLTNGDVTIGSASNPQITIDLAKVKFSNFEKSYGNNDIVTASVDFKAFYDVGESSMIDVELINETSSY